MPRTIGDVLSPTVAAALLRRGEQNLGTKVARGPTTTTTGGSEQAALELAIRRDERKQEAADRAEDRANRNEDRVDRGFEFKQDEFGKNREERKGKASRDDRRLKLSEAAGQGKIRQQAQDILNRMGGLLRRSRAINRDTGRSDPATVQEAQTIARALWQQYLSLNLPEEEKAAAFAQMQSLLPTTPASRAPGNAQGSPGGAPTGGGLVDNTLSSSIGIPTRTP